MDGLRLTTLLSVKSLEKHVSVTKRITYLFLYFFIVNKDKIFHRSGFFKNEQNKSKNFKSNKKKKFYLDYSLDNGNFKT
jgi:hypothetical protein